MSDAQFGFAMDGTERAISREGLFEVARHLRDLKSATESFRLRRTLGDCASRLESAARALPTAPNSIPFLHPDIVAAAQGLERSLGIRQGNAWRMLTLLLVEPGVPVPTPELGGWLCVSQASVRVYAFHLRQWLAARGMPDALSCRWGEGYAIGAADAHRLLPQFPHLQLLVSVVLERCGSPACWRSAFDSMEPAATADPFPVVRRSALEARVSA